MHAKKEEIHNQQPCTYVLVHDVRTHPPDMEPPSVIYLTASGHEDDVMNAIRLGAVNYLKKPFLPQDLMERIAKEFDKK